MKKVLLVLVVVVLVLSGVAAVSAYEAQIINVHAHVENAMAVRAAKIDFGTVFPEEWVTVNFTVGTSDSFCAPTQNRTYNITYSIFAEWKLLSNNGTPNDPADDTYYPWLGDALYVGIDAQIPKPKLAGGNLTCVGPPPATQPGAVWVMDSPRPLQKVDAPPHGYNLNDLIWVGLDVPVFEGYYNELTDMLQEDGSYLPKPSGLDDPTLVILETDVDRYFPDGVDLGLDLKFQVTNIW